MELNFFNQIILNSEILRIKAFRNVEQQKKIII